jgi:hypothetical protein
MRDALAYAAWIGIHLAIIALAIVLPAIEGNS